MVSRILFFVLCLAGMNMPVSAVEVEPETAEDTPPGFQGGDMVTFKRWVLSQLAFSENFYDNGEEITAVVEFEIGKNGKLKFERIRDTSDEYCAKEVQRIVEESPVWTPALSDGKPIVSKQVLPLNILLREKPDGGLYADDNAVYTKAGSMPLFEGGRAAKFREWLRKSVDPRFESDGRRVDTCAALSFVIEKDGALSEVRVIGMTDSLESDAVKQLVAAAPRWTPAVEQSQPVRIRCSFPLGKCPGEPTDPDAYSLDEVMPLFGTDGMSEFRQWVVVNSKYPEEALKANIEGRVTLTLIVEKDGGIRHVRVVDSPSKLLSDEAVRVVLRSPRWRPGTLGGIAVRVRYTLPLDFSMLRPYPGKTPEPPSFAPISVR